MSCILAAKITLNFSLYSRGPESVGENATRSHLEVVGQQFEKGTHPICWSVDSIRQNVLRIFQEISVQISLKANKQKLLVS